MTTATDKLINERLAYPAKSPLKYLYKTPILLYRLGMKRMIGRLFMVLTTTGRKSGLPRRTALEFHQFDGHKYVFVGWTQSDWYNNIIADPLVTIQTADGVEHLRARHVETDEERTRVWRAAENSPGIQMAMKLSGITLTEATFVTEKDRFVILTFDPTDAPTPPPLEEDLRWMLPAVMNVVGSVLIQRAIRRRLRARQLQRAQRQESA